jgi:hypothetical protein
MMKAVLTYVFLLSLFVFPMIAYGGTSDNISGYAWSANVGWISFNCTNDSSCGAVDYGVNKDGSGNLSGYAWSSNVGWIQFGGLAGFPSGSGTFSQNAQFSGVDLRGWAKAINADNNGWDGWISLRGTNYGVSQAGSTFTGYAWGSDVVGWILFDIQNVYPSVCANCGVTTSGDATLDVKSGAVSINGNGAVAYNTVPTFEWTLTDLPSATCTLAKTAGGTAFTTVNNITSSGSLAGNALSSSGLHSYSLDCINPTISKQVSFTVAPQPAGFSLGGQERARIQFLTSGSSDSEIKNIFVTPVGGFNNSVTVSISTYPTPPGGVTFLYSLGGGAFVANPAPVTINPPFNAGTTFQVRISDQITIPYTVTLTGVGGTAPDATKNIVIDPTSFDPSFEEI